MSACFWNTRGLINKIYAWNYIEKFDILELIKTWVEEKQWERLKEKLPNKFKWIYIPAIKEKKKARPEDVRDAEEGARKLKNKVVKGEGRILLNKLAEKGCILQY